MEPKYRFGNIVPMQKRLLGLLVALTSLACYGQSQFGGASLNGLVTDPSGATITNAKVTATQTATNASRETLSTSDGLYSFASLQPGAYQLTVEATGFKTAKRDGLTLNIGALSTLDISLEVGTPTEVITVTEEAPIVETSRSQTSTTIDTRSVSELPINGRNFLDFALLTPGVVRDPTRGGDITFGGQRGTMNSLTVDGSDSNNVFFGQSTGRAGSGRSPYSFSQDAVQEFQVSTNAFAAENGRAGGGLINVITKSGTNQLHGTLFHFFRDRSLNANTFINNRNGAAKGQYHFNQFGGNIGGPIAKDKLFFFFDYDGQRNSESITTVFGGAAAPSDAASQAGRALLLPYLTQYPRRLDNNVYLVKGDWQINDAQRLSVRFNSNRFVGNNFENGGAQSALEHTGNSKVSTDNISFNHNFVLSPTLVLESRVTYTRDDEPGEANSSAPEAIIRQGGANVMSIGRNSFSPRYTNAKTLQWAEGLSWVVGNHTAKFGVDVINQRIDNFFPGNFSGSYTFNSYADFFNKTPASFTQAFAGANTDGALTKPNVNEIAFYVQDSWRATSRLTLNYGLRYDLFAYAQPPLQNPNARLLADNLDTSLLNRDKNNWGPRFGFAYRVNKSGSTVVRGGMGMYFARTPAIMVGTAFSQNGIQVQTYTLNNNFPTYPNVLAAPPTLNRTPDIYVFAKNYVQPLTYQWSLNIDQALGNNYAVTIGYLGVRGQNLSRTRDINRFPATPVTATYSTGGTATFFRYSGRPNTSFGRISLFDSGADSNYHGGFVQLTKRLSQSFQVQSSYTFSKVIDSKPDFTSVVVGVDDSKNAFDTLNPQWERGRGNADIRHKFVFSGIWDINYGARMSNPILRHIFSGYQLSLISNVQSGRPFTATIGGDPNGDGNTATDRPPAFDRNTITGPNSMTVDTRITRDFGLRGERVKLRIIFEAFNATNRANFTAIRTAPFAYNATTRVLTPDASFKDVTGTTSDPRILQLAGKITF
jgi:outer membrane receptor protein involved in Fe transport